MGLYRKLICDIAYLHDNIHRKMTTFYDNINDFFEKDTAVKDNIKEPYINILHSRIIKDYKQYSDTNEYFEDKVMSRFNEYLPVGTDADNEVFDDICERIIFIYYDSIAGLDEYYGGIYKKKRFYL